MLRFLLIILVAWLFGLAMFTINHEPLNSPLTVIVALLAGLASLGFIIRHFLLPVRWIWWFIRILTPRTNGEHPLAQALVLDDLHPTPQSGTGSLLHRALARAERVRTRSERKLARQERRRERLEKEAAEAHLRRAADAEAHRQLQIRNQSFIEKYRSTSNAHSALHEQLVPSSDLKKPFPYRRF